MLKCPCRIVFSYEARANNKPADHMCNRALVAKKDLEESLLGYYTLRGEAPFDPWGTVHV